MKPDSSKREGSKGGQHEKHGILLMFESLLSTVTQDNLGWWHKNMFSNYFDSPVTERPWNIATTLNPNGLMTSL
jgi:hypothetical protein